MANITVWVDDDLKRQSEELLRDLGLDLSTAVTAFLKQSVREQAMPFQLCREVPNAVTLAAMKEVDDMAAHPEKYPVYHDIESLMEELLL